MSDSRRIKEAFEPIRADEALKSSTRQFLFQKTKQYRKRRFFPYRQAAIVMACLLFVVLGQRGYSAYFTSVSTISIDVNPSVELDINRFEKVIDIKSYNEDGDAVVFSADIRFLDYRDALSQLLQNETLARYLTPEQLVVITVFSDNEERNTELLAGVTACTSSYQNVHCSSSNSAEVREAHALGLSYGKYRAFLALQALDPSITPEDVSGLTMRQIRDRINALSGDAANSHKACSAN